ncbi:unnamed protein product, partial [Durusdinium trenchii]
VLGALPALVRFARSWTQRRATVDVVRDQPLIWVVDGLCEQQHVQQLKEILDQQDVSFVRKTDAYVDDMFDERRELQEDAQMLVSMMSSGALQMAPSKYQSDPLRSLLWLAMQRPELLQTSAWDIGQLSTTRRAWCAQWNPEDLARSGFRKSAFRCKVPEEMLSHLAPLVVDVLGAPVQGLPGTDSARGAVAPSWALRDTTVVRYQQDESQVPHIDTSDVTMLLYLSDDGGHTCFPNLGCSIPPREGRILVFCSTSPSNRRFGGFAGSAYGEPLDATMHYGGLMEKCNGEKLIVQLLFAAEDSSLPLDGSWSPALRGAKVREAGRTQNMEAQSMTIPSVARRRQSLVFSNRRCASGCKGLALDLEVPGATKVCVHCWQHPG